MFSKISKKEKFIEELQSLTIGQLYVAQEIIKNEKKVGLSKQEINEIFANIINEKQKFKSVEEYRKNCPILDKKCMGTPNLTNAGCIDCMNKGVFDVKNGLPEFGTEEYNVLEAKKKKAIEKAVKKCNLGKNKNYCEYKGVFNYCAMCNKEFKRSR